MANDLNQCNFIGRLGNDPEIRYSPSGLAIASLSIAVGKKYKKDNQVVETTNWVSLTAFGKMAEIIGEYLRKGSQIHASCEYNLEKWQDQSGQDRYTPKFIIQNMQMLGSAQGGQQRQQPQQKGGWGQPQQPQQSPQQPPQQQYNEPPMDFDDDIPF
jgi:single-strand DNA-binding protein